MSKPRRMTFHRRIFSFMEGRSCLFYESWVIVFKGGHWAYSWVVSMTSHNEVKTVSRGLLQTFWAPFYLIHEPWKWLLKGQNWLFPTTPSRRALNAASGGVTTPLSRCQRRRSCKVPISFKELHGFYRLYIRRLSILFLTFALLYFPDWRFKTAATWLS